MLISIRSKDSYNERYIAKVTSIPENVEILFEQEVHRNFLYVVFNSVHCCL